jgi:hypothetical protein
MGVRRFGQETEGVSSKWNWILCDIIICVCWELDSLGRRLRGSAVIGTEYCVTLWFVCVGSWTFWAEDWGGQQQMELNIVWYYDFCTLGVGHFRQKTEGVSSKWNCILDDIMICVCWQAWTGITGKVAVTINNILHVCWYFTLLVWFWVLHSVDISSAYWR